MSVDSGFRLYAEFEGSGFRVLEFTLCLYRSALNSGDSATLAGLFGKNENRAVLGQMLSGGASRVGSAPIRPSYKQL